MQENQESILSQLLFAQEILEAPNSSVVEKNQYVVTKRD
jgi:hypothetical protein